MKLRVLGCYGGNVPELGMTSFLVNDTVCLDAGFVSGALSLREQVKVKDVIISHSHLDHTCSLPFLIDNNFSAPGFILRIYAIREVIASMKNHLFNNHTWPDFTCLPNDLTPVLKLVEIPEERPFKVNGLSVRAIRVSHTVPTTGFVVEDKSGDGRLLERHRAHRALLGSGQQDAQPEGRDRRDVVPQRAPGPRQRLGPPHAPDARPRARQAGARRPGLSLRRQAPPPRPHPRPGPRPAAAASWRSWCKARRTSSDGGLRRPPQTPRALRWSESTFARSLLP